jgi:hypothetical protein
MLLPEKGDMTKKAFGEKIWKIAKKRRRNKEEKKKKKEKKEKKEKNGEKFNKQDYFSPYLHQGHQSPHFFSITLMIDCLYFFPIYLREVKKLSV